MSLGQAVIFTVCGTTIEKQQQHLLFLPVISSVETNRFGVALIYLTPDSRMAPHLLLEEI